MRVFPSLLALVAFPALGIGPLNDTGIDFCADGATNTAPCDSSTYPRQDASLGRDAQAAAGTLAKVGGGGKGFDFTKIANNGAALPATATLGYGPSDWACVRDNVTGLWWEVKVNDPSHLRHQGWSYTWYDSAHDYFNNGNYGTSSGGICKTSGRCDTEKFAADVNAAGLCGHRDWRVSDIQELQSIVDYGRDNPAIDISNFPNTPY